jgi:hypothetical protein
MRPIHPNTVQKFASAFAYGRNGLSLQELLDYFAQYQANVPSLHSLQPGTTKGSAFLECVASLSPENQRQALYDLCGNPPPAQHPMPNEEVRQDLLVHLMQGDGRSSLGVSLSELTLRGLRNQWFTAASPLPESAASAITAARALLETTCKVFISYSSIDRQKARSIARTLKTQEIPHFLDKKDMSWGDRMTQSISNGFNEGTELVVIISSNSLNSKWVPFEIGYAKGKGTTILPLMIDPTLEVPGYLSELHHISSNEQLRDYFIGDRKQQKGSLDGDWDILYRLPESGEYLAAFLTLKMTGSTHVVASGVSTKSQTGKKRNRPLKLTGEFVGGVLTFRFQDTNMPEGLFVAVGVMKMLKAGATLEGKITYCDVNSRIVQLDDYALKRRRKKAHNHALMRTP